eukprot:jgi/Botrbrau1/8628/Bobra.0196s0022.1
MAELSLHCALRPSNVPRYAIRTVLVRVSLRLCRWQFVIVNDVGELNLSASVDAGHCETAPVHVVKAPGNRDRLFTMLTS